jgi:hypothetical protein
MDALDYERSLETRLRKMAPEYRRCFAVWCLNGTILKCKALRERMKSEDVNVILELYDTMSSSFIDGNISDENFDMIEEELRKLTDDVDNKDDIASEYALKGFFDILSSSMVDTLDVIRTGEVGSATFLGMRILDFIGIELDERGIKLSGNQFFCVLMSKLKSRRSLKC